MASILERESSFCDGDQNRGIVSSLYAQKQAMLFCDVVMKVCGKDIYAHSNVLAAASPYFNSFLGQGLPRQFSQRSPQLIEIQIDGSEPSALYEEAVTVVIDYIYTGRLSVRDSNAGQIAEIARIMQMNKIVKFCDDFLCGTLSEDSLNQVSQGLGDGSQKFLTDVATNTEALDSESAFVKAFQATFQGESSAPKTRTKGLVSVSTQVIPKLLGLPGNPQNPEVETSAKGTSTEGLLAYPWGSLQHQLKLAKSDAIPESEYNVFHTGKRGRPRKHPVPLDSAEQPAKKLKTTSGTPNGEEVCDKAAGQEDDDGPEVDQHVSTGDPDTDNVPEGDLEEEQATGSDTGKLSGDMSDQLDSETEEASKQTQVPNKVKKPAKITTGMAVKKVKPEEPVALAVRRGRRSIKPTAKMSAFADEFSTFLQSGSLPHGVVVKQEKVDKETESESQVNHSDSQGSEEEIGEIDNEISHTEFLEYVMEENETRDNQHAQMVEIGAEELVNSQDSGEKPIKRGRGRPRKHRIKEEVGDVSVIIGKYQCDSCDFTTNKVRDMGSHRKLHKLAQNTCYYCDQKFDDKDILTTHMEKHKGPKPFFCPLCAIRFKTRTQLNLHLPKHSDDKPFICEICCQGFKWKHALKNHMITHSNRKDQLCDFCGYATAHKSQLKAHKLIHTGQTFKCSYPDCSFQATKAQNMKYHLLTHSRERPHQCEVCGQNFSLVKNMKRHMLLHMTEKAHKCQRCTFASTRFDKLKEHLLKQHSIGTPPEKRLLVADIVKQDQLMMASAHPFKRELSEELDEESVAIPEHYQLVQVVSADGTTEEQLVAELHPVLMAANEGSITNIIIPQPDAPEALQIPVQHNEAAAEEAQEGDPIIQATPDQVLDQCASVDTQILSTEDGETIIVSQAGDTDYSGYTQTVMIPASQMSNLITPYVTQSEPSDTQ